MNEEILLALKEEKKNRDQDRKTKREIVKLERELHPSIFNKISDLIGRFM